MLDAMIALASNRTCFVDKNKLETGFVRIGITHRYAASMEGIAVMGLESLVVQTSHVAVAYVLSRHPVLKI